MGFRKIITLNIFTQILKHTIKKMSKDITLNLIKWCYSTCSRDPIFKAEYFKSMWHWSLQCTPRIQLALGFRISLKYRNVPLLHRMTCSFSFSGFLKYFISTGPKVSVENFHLFCLLPQHIMCFDARFLLLTRKC